MERNQEGEVNPYYHNVPENSFIARYLRFMATQETAHAYDFWCALWTLGCACGRATYVARPRAPVYLNMYLILVGDSGIPRKTTSVNMALSLIRDLYADEQTLGIIDAKLTSEHLDLVIHERTKKFGSGQVVIGVPELAVFMGSEAYLANMPATLTDLYDCPVNRQGGTIARGLSEQHNVWVSLISGSTPIWLLKTVNPKVVEGGFSSRCMFVVANKPKQSIPWPVEEDNDAIREHLISDLRHCHSRANTCDPIRIVDTALDLFREWYATRDHSTDPFKQSFEAREDAHVLRIAALLGINDGSWEIQHKHVQLAIKLINTIKVSSGAMFEYGISRTKYAAAFDVIRTMLISKGMDPVARHILQRKCRYWIHSSELTMLMEVMHEFGVVQRFQSMPDRGRPTEYFRGTEKMLDRGIGEKILDHFT